MRIEELVNYFKYDYPQPSGGEPFSVNVEIAGCPWNGEHRLLRAEDFADDTKDAGEIGAGHTVTALYEIVPPGAAAASFGMLLRDSKYKGNATFASVIEVAGSSLVGDPNGYRAEFLGIAGLAGEMPRLERGPR